MTRQRSTLSSIVCGLLLLICVGLSYCRARNGLSLAMLRQSEEVGRLRRGFQTSSLATARGFGKRSSSGPYEIIPFINRPENYDFVDRVSDGKHAEFERFMERFPNKVERYPIGAVAEMLKLDKDLAKSLLSKFLDADGDGLISLEEILHAQ